MKNTFKIIIPINIMYFCPKCNYSFDIRKNTMSSDSKVLESVNDILKVIKSKDVSKYSTTLNFKDIEKNKKYLKLSDKDKEKVMSIFNSSNVVAEFNCKNCNFSKNITESLVLYKVNKKITENFKFDIETNKFLINDPTLPRTKDYKCFNVNCLTHKKPELKEAVFYKKNNELIYICSNCYYSWSL